MVIFNDITCTAQCVIVASMVQVAMLVLTIYSCIYYKPNITPVIFFNLLKL